ncbi:hypothetical protein CEXT_81811 [Caerostris extrusa]|uniref:Uncharacterized protein n=1 Tax=Caerostris extrusa TaxID=172846 RepID=A0AAV4X0K7_CAEEX|nr:hypothetical protein CEXT_81811 [Caerostris extrusa]
MSSDEGSKRNQDSSNPPPNHHPPQTHISQAGERPNSPLLMQATSPLDERDGLSQVFKLASQLSFASCLQVHWYSAQCKPLKSPQRLLQYFHLISWRQVHFQAPTLAWCLPPFENLFVPKTARGKVKVLWPSLPTFCFEVQKRIRAVRDIFPTPSPKQVKKACTGDLKRFVFTKIFRWYLCLERMSNGKDSCYAPHW